MSKDADRLPPGQYLTRDWPVLHYGTVPKIDLNRWNFKLFGLVAAPLTLSHAQFLALPRRTVTRDIHCVTHWSRFDTSFEGVPFQAVIDLVEVQPAATHAMVWAEGGWNTNLPLSDLAGEDVLFAMKADGRDLTPEHGWPLRLVVPHLYFWKSAKWVRGIELMAADKPGFWERNGYHRRGDPWQEERYDED